MLYVPSIGQVNIFSVPLGNTVIISKYLVFGHQSASLLYGTRMEYEVFMGSFGKSSNILSPAAREKVRRSHSDPGLGTLFRRKFSRVVLAGQWRQVLEHTAARYGRRRISYRRHVAYLLLKNVVDRLAAFLALFLLHVSPLFLAAYVLPLVTNATECAAPHLHALDTRGVEIWSCAKLRLRHDVRVAVTCSHATQNFAEHLRALAPSPRSH